MALSVRHYQKGHGWKTLCGMHHMRTNSVSGLYTTDDKRKVTCKKCIRVMKKWKWEL